MPGVGFRLGLWIGIGVGIELRLVLEIGIGTELELGLGLGLCESQEAAHRQALHAEAPSGDLG